MWLYFRFRNNCEIVSYYKSIFPVKHSICFPSNTAIFIRQIRDIKLIIEKFVDLRFVFLCCIQTSKARVCGRELSGIAGSNYARGMVSFVCVVRIKVCDGPIPRQEEPYRLCCVITHGLEASRMSGPWSAFGCCDRVKRIPFPPVRELR